MKNVAYLLLAGGFLVGAYATALNVQSVDWALFGMAALAAIAGVVMAKRADRAHATSGTVLDTNRKELSESIGNIVRDLGTMTDGTAAKGEELRNWIDETLRPDLRRFVDARQSMVHLFGMERYVNRVWSSSADGYDEEAAIYLKKAAAQFEEAQQQLAAAAEAS
jgi:hypothetical protein